MTENCRSLAWLDALPDRCRGCLMHKAVCLCGNIPRLVIKNAVRLILAPGEISKPSNTARFLPLALSNCNIIEFGVFNEPLDLRATIQSMPNPWLLFPTSSARTLNHDFVQNNPEITLIVPDGTWRQSLRLSHKLIERTGLPCLKLAEVVTSKYSLRKKQRPGGVCTLEAVAAALEILEGSDRGPQIRATLESLLAAMVSRYQWMANNRAGPYKGDPLLG